MADNPLPSSFIMLSEHLYDIFVQYILSGRTRAPPENDLVEMISTFQFGAKTDRRALQSKFKSWAKRMNYENGYLTLANSGKLIISSEKCDDLIMLMHSEEHHNIEKVITQIRMKYSWTKKNFGMDRDVVVNCIARNCKNQSCLQNMKMELAKLGSNFCSGTGNPVTPKAAVTPESAFRMPSSIPFIPPYPFRWPLPFPLAPVISPSGFRFQVPPIDAKYYNMAITNRHGIPSDFLRNIDKNNTSKLIFNSRQDVVPTPRPFSATKVVSSHTSGEEVVMSATKFFRPKNEYEYKILMEAAKQNPEDFPDILKNEKTKFLSVLGIAPKSICRSRTLKKFLKEHKRQKFLNRESMIYRERKTLRDRNKLKKCSIDNRHLYFMQASIRHPSLPRNSASETILGKRKENKLEKGIKKKLKSINPNEKKPVEIIDIASSDDETQKENSFPDNNIKEKEMEDLKTTKDQLSQFPGHEVPKLTKEERYNKQSNNYLHEDEKRLETQKGQSEVNINPVDQTTLHHFLSANRGPLIDLSTNILNSKPVLKLNGMRHCSTNIKPLDASSYLAVKHIESLPVSRSQIGYKNVHSNLGNNYIFSPINPVTVGMRKLAPSLVQGGNTGVPNENSVPQNVYSIPVSGPVSSPSVFFVDKQRKGTFYVIPQLPATVLPPNLQIGEPSEAISMSKSVTVPNFIPCLTSELQQQRTAGATRVQLQNDSDGNTSKKDNKSNVNINEEIARISNWIYRMKANLNPNMFQQGIEKSVQKLISQLNVGIYLVREARNSLTEIEKTADLKKRDTEVVK